MAADRLKKSKKTKKVFDKRTFRRYNIACMTMRLGEIDAAEPVCSQR
jgi:hypothetical protein